MTTVPEALERARRSWLVLFARLAFRLVAGRDLTGHARTTATFLRPGDCPDPRGAWWFQHHPGHRRARFRALTLLTAAGAGYLRLTDPALLWWLVVAAVVVAVPTLGMTLWTVAANHQHRQRFGVGIARWLRESYGHQTSVTVPRVHLDDPDHPAVLRFPPGTAFSETEKPKIAKKAADKLGLTDYQAEWEMVGRPLLRISTAPLPPQRVNIADKTHVLDNECPDGVFYIGEGSRQQEVLTHFDNEAPHPLVSAPTRRGKSALYRGICAQILHKGGVLIIADVKRFSHMWANNLPNVNYCRDDEAIHNGIIEFAEEVARRNHIAEQHADINGDVDPAVIGPRIALLLEEINATQKVLQSYWKRVRNPACDPLQSPAVTALHAVLFMGGAVLAHVLAAGQRVSASSLGGGDARENFGTRILIGATANTWKMLAPECAVRGKFPASSPIKGRVHVVNDEAAVLTQVALWTNEEARAYALSGTVTPYADAVQGRTVLRVESQVNRDTTPLVSLRDAHERHGIGASLDALRRASTRPGFIDAAETFGDKNLYDLDELRRWEANRVRPREVAR